MNKINKFKAKKKIYKIYNKKMEILKKNKNNSVKCCLEKFWERKNKLKKENLMF